MDPAITVVKENKEKRKLQNNAVVKKFGKSKVIPDLTMSMDASPRQAEAQAYLHDHRVLELFDNLTSMLIFSRPEKPKNFLIDVLESLQVRTGKGMG